MDDSLTFDRLLEDYNMIATALVALLRRSGVIVITNIELDAVRINPGDLLLVEGENDLMLTLYQENVRPN